jgi:hypothetical protein
MSMLANVLDTRQGPRSDRELVASCLSGDEPAWSELIDRYNRLIFSIPLKQGLTREEAADIFQAVCSISSRTSPPARSTGAAGLAHSDDAAQGVEVAPPQRSLCAGRRHSHGERAGA